MKMCLCCFAEVSLGTATCPKCGEGSWQVQASTPTLARPSRARVTKKKPLFGVQPQDDGDPFDVDEE